MQIVELHSAKNYIESISLTGPRLWSPTRKFIFRGQSNADWQAIPSAFRPGALLIDDLGMLNNSSSRTNREQVYAEMRTIEAFIEILNDHGQHVPNEGALGMHLQNPGYLGFDSAIGRGEATWPPDGWHSTVAIAQHYGIPTRFLDFSYDPLVALYFATTGSIKKNCTGKIAVYAIDCTYCGLPDGEFSHPIPTGRQGRTPENHTHYRLIKSPSWFNANLRAQKGVFLACTQTSFHANDPFTPYSLESHLDRSDRPQDNYKFIINSNQSEELLFLLYKKFYSAAALFPGIASCVESLYERSSMLAYWDRS